MEWGLQGINELAPFSDCLVIVDVMSFSTCVDIVLGRGGTVLPFPWKDERAMAYAKENNAIAASIKRRFGKDGYSLSPHSLMEVPEGIRLVLPSPNGSTAVFQARTLGIPVYVGCLRNAQATADACSQYKRIGVIACGERWEVDHSLRPALEDLLGAGAIVGALAGTKSPEARSAEALFRSSISEISSIIRSCSSGYELLERGFPDDVDLCSQINSSDAICKLVDMELINPKKEADR